MKTYSIKISTSLLALSLNLGCQGIQEGRKAAAPEQHPVHSKWLELAAELKLPPELHKTSDFLNPNNAKEFVGLVFEAAARINSKAYAYKCAAIESFDVQSDIQAVDAEGNALEADVYVMGYKLQADFDGNAEAQARHGLVTVPRAASKAGYALMAYAHTDDKGLAYAHMAQNLGKLQESYIVVAPTFPGEQLHDRSDIAPVGVSVPWANDVDELLGMHDCLASFLQYENIKKKNAPRKSSRFTKAEVIAEIIEQEAWLAGFESTISQDLKDELKALLLPKASFYKGQNAFSDYPKSVLFGGSRGGMVASLALAKSGAVLGHLAQSKNSSGQSPDPEIFTALFTKKGLSPKTAKYLGENLGKKYGPIPPVFHGLATVGAPATVTAGSFRVIFEQMVKGNLHRTSAHDLTGVRRLGNLFDAYRAGEVDAKEAKFEIVLRDVSLLSPLMVAALKDWHNPLLPGSILILHGKQDKVVPYHQAQIAYNVLQGLSENKMIKEVTLSPFGLNMFVRIFDRFADGEEGVSKKGSFHFDEAFYNSKSLLPRDFIVPQGRASYFDQRSYDLPVLETEGMPELQKSILAEYRQAAAAAGMRDLKVADLQQAFVTLQSKGLVAADPSYFTEENLAGNFRVEGEKNKDANEVAASSAHVQPDLDLLTSYLMTSGYLRQIKNGKGLDESKLQVVERKDHHDDTSYRSLYDGLRPVEVIEEWGRFIAQ